MRQTPTKEQREALDKILANGGEAIKDYSYYWAGGRIVCDYLMMERMARKKLVRLEKVDESTFAVPIEC